MKQATTTTAVPAPPRMSALAEMDQAARRVREDVEAAERVKADRWRQAALTDARAALEAWRALEVELRAFGAGDPLVRVQHLVESLQREVDACLTLRELLEETVMRQVAQLGTWIADLETLDLVTGTARLDAITAGLREAPIALAAVKRQRLAWYAQRRRAGDALRDAANTLYHVAKLVHVPAALVKRAEAELPHPEQAA